MRVPNPLTFTSEKSDSIVTRNKWIGVRLLPELGYVIIFTLKPKYKCLKEMMGWGNIAENTEMPEEIVGVGVNFLCRVPFTADRCKL